MTMLSYADSYTDDKTCILEPQVIYSWKYLFMTENCNLINLCTTQTPQVTSHTDLNK